MRIPPTIRVGDTTTWRDLAAADSLGNAITSADWTLTYYLRTNSASAGVTITASAYGTGWESTISASTSAGLTAVTWYWQAIASRGSERHTLGAGSLTVLAALSYTGTPGAVDGRSQSQQDLDAVQAAMRALVAGGSVKSYTIGNRQLTKFTLAELRERESILLARVNREKAAEMIANGLGSPRNLFVRFS